MLLTSRMHHVIGNNEIEGGGEASVVAEMAKTLSLRLQAPGDRAGVTGRPAVRVLVGTSRMERGDFEVGRTHLQAYPGRVWSVGNPEKRESRARRKAQPLKRRRRFILLPFSQKHLSSHTPCCPIDIVRSQSRRLKELFVSFQDADM